MNFFQYFQQNSGMVWLHTLEHLRLTLTAVAISIILGVPLGILISHLRRLYKPVVGTANVVQAIPSLALLGFLIPLLGIGALPGITMVVIYSLLPIIKNTATGLDNIDPEVIEAATGIGMTPWQILFRVQLPLALPVIMTGIRISAVTAVGLVTLAAYIGAGGLGYLVYSGIRMVNNNLILSGAIPACIMALLIDYACALVEGAVTPVSLRPDVKSIDSRRLARIKMRKVVTLIAAAAAIVMIIAANVMHGRGDSRPAIRVGTKEYTEQVILGHIFAELLEDRTNFRVDRKFGLGGTQIVFQAMTNDELDMYVEYDGTAYRTTLGYEDQPDVEEVGRRVRADFLEKYNLIGLDNLGFNNTYAMMVMPEIAEKYGLKTLSDLARASSKITVGSGIEFINRMDGLKGMIEVYGMNFKEVLGVDGGVPKYAAILSGQTQTSDAFSTDGTLVKYNMVLLQDDKNFFPPYNAMPVIRSEILDRYPELREVFNLLAGQLNDEQMRMLNYEADVKERDPGEIAREFLRKRGLING